MRRTASLFLMIIILSGCAGRNPLTVYRPNARTPLEQTAYNTLLVSERMITEAERSNEAGTLPEFMRPIVNGLIDAHNLGRAASQVYVAALDAGESPDEAGVILVERINELDQVITMMFNRGGG